MNKKIEFGDFQTPKNLALRCTKKLSKLFQPEYVIEPTCGLGYFLEASFETWLEADLVAYEINKKYIQEFKKRCPHIKAKIFHKDFFSLSLEKILPLNKKILLIGNPPWVTNSQLGSLESKNLPKKINNKKEGLSALLGKSNFDISEWILTELSKELYVRKGVMAMLVKTSVARKVFLNNLKNGQKNVSYSLYKIDAKKEFNVSVDACFFIVDYRGGNESICHVFDSLESKKSSSSFAYEEEQLISDFKKFKQSKYIRGKSKYIWRSGLKHDCSKVMELIKKDGIYYNGYDEKVLIEEEYIYPLFKSSDLANDRKFSRYVIVPQKKIGEDTALLKEKAPLLWKYLNSKSQYLDKRKSKIYTSQPRFSIFGVGEYSFKKYKIAISGLYSCKKFRLLKTVQGKPIMFDDTCYVLSFDSLSEAKKCLEKLESNVVQEYIESLSFPDSKRQITSSLLNYIDLDKV